jgi:fimbrial chaperone protein
LNVRSILLGVFSAGLGLLPGPGRVLAQTLEVTPIQVELTPAAPSEIITLHNRSAEAVRYQVSAFAWDQTRAGEMQLARTKDVHFFPSLLTVGAGEKRNVRVSTATKPGPVERTYRLFVEQLPPGPSESQSGVRVLTRVGIPVFVAPRTPMPAAEVSALAVERGKISFVLENTGNLRTRPKLVRVVGRGGDGKILFDQPVPSWYVLAGGERAFEVEAPREHCRGVRNVSVEAVLEKSTIGAELPVAGGACAP